MKEKKLERDHGHGGLEPVDVELLFPDPAGDEDAQPKNPEAVLPGPLFEGEPWPDVPFGDSALQEDLELPLARALDIHPIKPIGYPPRAVRRLAPLPSSSSWFMELQKILLGD